MDLLAPNAFSPPRPASETADLVDLPQAKALSQPEASARGRPSLAHRLVALMVTRSVSEELFVPHLRFGL